MARNLKYLIFLIAFSPIFSFSQTGPGGVGNSAGTPGQPQNVVWFRAGIGVNSSGGLVNSWADQSGNANNAIGVGTTRPTINATDPNFNGLSSITFPVKGAGPNYNLVVQDANNLDGTTGLTVFYIFRPQDASSTLGILSKRVDNGSNQSYTFYQTGGLTMTSRIGSDNVTAGSIANGNVYIASTVYDGTLASGSRIAPFLDGIAQTAGTGPATITNTVSDLHIGAFDLSSGETRSFEGQLAEIVVYRQALNPAQRQIVENYLSAKYATTLTGDIYAGDTPGNGNYDFEVIGIGRSGGQNHTESNSAGFLLSTYDATFDVDGEFVLAGHNGVANGVSVANLGAGVQQRWARSWFVDKTTAGSLNAALTFDFSEGVGGQFPANKNNYVLLRLTAGNYEIVPIANGSKIVVGDKMTFHVPNADLIDGVYTLGTIDATNSPLLGAANRTWYSYQTGNWTTPTVWTLDGGVVPLLVNPLNEIPSAIDSVVITSGRTVTLNTSNVSLVGITVRGTLDLAATSGNSFTRISGDGRIRMSGNAGVDNFPAGNASGFADPSLGGTLELNGAGITLNSNRVFNNLLINMNATGSVISLESNWTLNGNLTLNQGQWRFGNNVATIARSLTLAGNLSVETSGQIRTGTGNARHQFNLYGDLLNNGGDIQFTNRLAANYATEATDGIVDVNLLSPIQNQTLNLAGPSRFYRIEIDKGVDQTYVATITGNPGMFNLFGYANENHGDVLQLNDNNNALGLVRGTVEIGANITIVQLTTGSNYNISEGAALWVNGGAVSKTSGTALVPYGLVRLTLGTLDLPINSGITTRNNGTIQVDGGTLTARQIRTSVNGVGNVGGYIQSGGDVIITGGTSTNLDYYVFSLTYPGNVFNMSGGNLTIRGARSGNGGTRGAIFINSDPANVSVTGGNIFAEINNANPFKITSRAPLWNLTTLNTFNTTLVDVDLDGGQSGDPGPTEVTLAPQPLVLLGGLTVGNYTNFDHNGMNVSIQGNFTIQTNGDYVYNAGKQNTTTINGTDNSLLAFYNRTVASANDEQRFWNFVIDKPADKIVTLESGKADRTGNNNNLLRTDGRYFKLLGGTLNQGTHSLRMYCDTVMVYGTLGLYNAATAGPDSNPNSDNDLIKLRDDGAQTKLLTINSAKIGNLRLNSGAEVIDLVSNLYIGRIEYRHGRINLSQYNLKLDFLNRGLGPEADSLGLSANKFSVEDMFITSGNASDGGLSLYIPAGTTGSNFLFPVGVGFADDNANNPNGAKYTPVTIRITDGVDDGYVTVNPVNGVLQTTNLAGGPDILNYYWRVRHADFTTLPTVARIDFTYNATDVGGTETNYVPGKVLDVNPFTRSSENNVNKVDESLKRIRFNTGFPLEQANYTAGAPTRFTGAPTVYYNRVANGNWNVNTTWSLTRGGAAAASVPGVGDVVVMRRTSVSYSGIVTIPSGYTANAAQVIFDDENGFASGCPRIIFQTGTPFSSNLGTVEVAATHQGGTLNGDIHGAVLQYNVNNTYSGIFPSGDFGGFNNYLNALVIYEWQSGTGTITLSSAATEYPQLWFQNGAANRIIKFPNVDVTVRGRAYITGDNQVMVNDGASSVRLNFQRNLEIGSGCCGGGTFLFPGVSGANQTVQVDGNILSTTGGGRNISILNAAGGTRQHTLIVKGNINIVTGATMNLGSGSASQTNVLLDLQGLGNNTFSNAGTVTLYRILMNKGTNTASSFSFNNNFTLTGTTNTATKAIELKNGTLIINNAAINQNLTTGGGDFYIPSTAGLQVNLGQVNVSGANTGILLDGLLRVNGGTVNLDGGVGVNNYIEYSASGNATLEVLAGTLTVGSQIRRNLTSTAGVLRYTQSGGTVVVGKNAAPSTSRGVFEVINTGSQFNLTGGSFTVVRGINSTTVPSLLLEPASSTITGSTITIGNANTPAGLEAQNIGVKSAIPINNLITSNASGNNPIVKLYSLPLTVNGTLTIGTGTTFDARGFSLYLGGNLVADGTYVPSNNTTFFTSNGAATITGASPSLGFYKATKNGTGTLTLGRPIIVNDELWLASGILSDAGNSITTKGTVTIDGTHTSSGGVGMVFNGGATQQLRRSSGGTGVLGIITIDNANSVLIPDGNGYNFLVNSGLRLSNGVFDIQGSLLELGVNAPITAVNPFGAANMIQTNSSFTDNGVQKNFNAGVTTDFIFPVGQGKYTPVQWNFSSPGYTSGGSAGTITVRPANERHPSVVEDVEVTPPQITDADNVLQYHWIVSATGFATSFRADAIMSYNQGDVQFEAPYTEADYIAARILTFNNPNADINKFPVTDVDKAANTIIFRFSGVNYLGIDGEYFAGVDPAIPDRLPVYTTVMSGVVDAAIYDVPVPGGGAPTGAIIQVSAGHTVDVDIDGISLYATRIATGGELVIDGTIGHRLGTVTGTGVLRLNSNTSSVVLPAGFYNQFFSCSGGGLAFGGSGNYDILGGITSLRNLTLDGSGQRILANNNLTICEDFIVNGADFTNPNNRTITINDELVVSSGSFVAGSGNITIYGTTELNGGIFDSGSAGIKNFYGNVIIDGGSFLSRSSDVRFRGDLSLLTGDFEGGSGFTYFLGTSTQTIFGDFQAGNAFYRLVVNNANGINVNSDIEIQRTFYLQNGIVNTSTNTILLSLVGNVNPTNGQSSSYVNGRFSKVISSGSTFTFPIGRGNRWRYLTVQSTSSGPRTWTAEYVDVAATFEPGVTNFTPTNAAIKTIARGEYWRVSDGSATPSGVSARIGLSWGIESDVNASSVEREDLQVMGWNSATSTWDNFGGTNFSAGHTQSQGDFRSSSALNFSTRIVTLGSSDILNPLPITLVSFTGEVKNGYNELTWITESELDNDYFVLERSTDNAETFEEVTPRLPGKGTTNQQSIYKAIDQYPVNGRNYYRLKQVDFNGDFSYANNIVVLYNEVSEYAYLDFTIHPNPTEYSDVNLKFFSNYPEVEAQIVIYDMQGKKVFEGSGTLFEDLPLKISQPISQGIYLVEVRQGKLKRAHRLMIK